MAMQAATRAAWPARLALRCADWAERWFPDAYVFAALGVAIVALAALGFGATPRATAEAFGKGYWSLIPFTMQMVFVVIGGYVLASAPIVSRAIDRLARVPRTGRGAVAFVATVSMLTSLLSWGFSLVFGGLLVRALAKRTELRMDYRAAGAAAYLGLGAVWAMGLSSSAAQLQANPASMPPALARDHRHPPVLANDPAVAVDRADGRVDRGVDRDCVVDRARGRGRARRAGGRATTCDGADRPRAERAPANGWNSARCSRSHCRCSPSAGWRASSLRARRAWPSPTSTPTTWCSSRWDCCCTGGRGASSTPSPKPCLRLRAC